MRLDDPRLAGSKFVVVNSSISFADAIARARIEYGSHVNILSQTEKEVGNFLGSKKSYEVCVWLNPPNKAITSQPNQHLSNTPKEVIPQKSSLVNNQSSENIKINQTNELLLQKLFDKVIQLEETQSKVLQKTKSGKRASFKEDGFEELARVYDILVNQNDFSAEFSKNLLDRVKKTLYGDELESREMVEAESLKELGRNLIFFDEQSEHTPRVFILVGTTGVGKTTTIVKLATVNLINDPHIDIRLINMDNYKIGAKEQLDTYASVLQRPVTTIYDTDEELVRAVADTKKSDLILVDTSGSSPHEVIRLADLKKALDHFGQYSEVHLAICASTKESDVRDILTNFELYRCKSVLITKLDETRRIGSFLAPLMEKRIPISYFTTGQNVGSKEIEKTNLYSIWTRLNGFSEQVIDKLLQHLE